MEVGMLKETGILSLPGRLPSERDTRPMGRSTVPRRFTRGPQTPQTFRE